jgi:DNA-binding transcriptional ArsR family regulator
MVTQEPTRSGSTFGAIADPTRRAILDLLRAGERSAGELAQSFDVSRPAVSRHIRVLRQAGLLAQRREAQSLIYSLQPDALAEVDAWLTRYRVFWAARLHALKHVVESAVAAETQSTPQRPALAGRKRRSRP